jgi:hypothetical protein
VIVAPPFDAGAVKATMACVLSATAVPIVGAPGKTGAIVSEIVPLVKLSAVGVLESVPETVKVKVPAAAGVPEMTPALESERPLGSAPLATVVAKVYGEFPPEADSVWL